MSFGWVETINKRFIGVDVCVICLGLKQRTSFTTIIVNFLKKKLDPRFAHRIDPFFQKIYSLAVLH